MKPELSLRQKEIIRLVSLGCSIYEIAAILGVSPSIVDNDKTRAMRAFGTDKAALMTRLAIKHRISSLQDKLTASEKRKSGRKRDGWN